jgi:hypothetical protein
MFDHSTAYLASACMLAYLIFGLPNGIRPIYKTREALEKRKESRAPHGCGRTARTTRGTATSGCAPGIVYTRRTSDRCRRAPSSCLAPAGARQTPSPLEGRVPNTAHWAPARIAHSSALSTGPRFFDIEDSAGSLLAAYSPESYGSSGHTALAAPSLACTRTLA